MTQRIGLASRVVLAVLRGYQRLVSPLLPPRCRYWPTCSEYARLAIGERGLIQGVAMAVGRLLRCQPLAPGGIDLPR